MAGTVYLGDFNFYGTIIMGFVAYIFSKILE